LRAGMRYSLKKALSSLGPSGYPFEQYVGRILQGHGYSVEVGRIIKGYCVSHEVMYWQKREMSISLWNANITAKAASRRC